MQYSDSLDTLFRPAQYKNIGWRIFEYECKLDGLSDRGQVYYKTLAERRKMKEQDNKARAHFTSGGNVVELPNHSIFASMSGPSSKIFIVTKNKEMLWSAIPEQKQTNDTIWGAAPTLQGKHYHQS